LAVLLLACLLHWHSILRWHQLYRNWAASTSPYFSLEWGKEHRHFNFADAAGQ